MVVVPILACFAALLLVGIDGKRYRTPCTNSYLFRCDNAICVHKHHWCDSSRHCSDGSDESYCNSNQALLCNEDTHFKCNSGTMCIPLEGYCDGYSSCPDQSDEDNCPCEELNETEEHIEYVAYIDQYRTQHKCWKISVKGHQRLELRITAKLKSRECIYGNITIYSGAQNESFSYYDRRVTIFPPNFETMCPEQQSSSLHNKSFDFYEDVFIRYRSNYYNRNGYSYKDDFNITFQKIDLVCNDKNAFKCSKNSCILPEKQCDGIKDCVNGLDEINCDYGVFSAEYLGVNRIKAAQWMRSQHNADWGWRENTHRAVVALYLAGDANYNGSSKDDDLIAKELELEVLTYLLRHKTDKMSSTELASYISALLVTCHDPRNFYGYDLIAILKEDLKTVSYYTPPFPYLTLCNAKEPISEEEIDSLLEVLEFSSEHLGFVFELQALAAMALSCIQNSGNLSMSLEQNIKVALNNLKNQQMEDGSFGNEYTTALVLQALIANKEENSKDWNPKSSIQFLTKMQEDNGSFGDLLTTYLIIPVLNAKSLIDVGKVNCTGSLKRPRDGNMVSNIKSRFGKKIVMNYSLLIGDEKDQIHPMLLRTPENITVLELMTLAAAINPKYKFKIHEIKKKKYVYEISNIANDPENDRFWFIYHNSNNETLPFLEQSPDKIQAHEKDHIIMWYKTLDSYLNITQTEL